MEINTDCNCVICDVELVPQGGFGPMHLEMGNSNETIRKICMECAEKVKNATAGNIGKRSLALQAKLDKIAMRVPPEKRKAFLKFVNTGDADGDFLDWLDNDPFARKPVEMAYQATADYYERLAENLPVELP